MNELKTIDHVITALDIILADCSRTQSRAGYFAALYKRMTIAVKDGIRNGYFADGPRMEGLDIVFAQRYLSAFHSFQNGSAVTSSWQCAFTGFDNQSLIVMQHLLLGINTYINLDLAIAAATVAPGNAIHALQTDFNRINSLIASLVDDVQHCLEEIWFPMRLLRNVINSQGRAVLNFSIEAAREAAWLNAVALANMNAVAQVKHIQQIDVTVCGIGNRITHPGFWPGLLLRLIRMTETEDVSRTIRLIDTTLIE